MALDEWHGETESRPTKDAPHCGSLMPAVILRVPENDSSYPSGGQNRSRGPARDAACLPDPAEEPALDAACLAQTAERFRRTESFAATHPGAGEFFEGGWRSARGGNRFEPRVSSLRLSGSRLL